MQFENELEPLIANIHGEVEHRGRRPNRQKQKTVGGEVLPESTEELTRVIGMRKDIRNAVEGEDYERAGKLRDNIQKILQKWHAEDWKD